MAFSINGTQHNNALPLCRMSFCWVSCFIQSNVGYHCTEGHYNECHYAECRVLFIIMLDIIILSVVILSAIMLSVVAPRLCLVLELLNVAIKHILLSVVMLNVVKLNVIALAHWPNKNKNRGYKIFPIGELLEGEKQKWNRWRIRETISSFLLFGFEFV